MHSHLSPSAFGLAPAILNLGSFCYIGSQGIAHKGEHILLMQLYTISLPIRSQFLLELWAKLYAENSENISMHFSCHLL